MTSNEQLIRVIEERDHFESEVKRLNSDEYVNKLKADAIIWAAWAVFESDEAGYIKGFHFLLSLAHKLRSK